MPPKLVEGLDYYVESGKYVFTEAYHLKRGYCCNSRCRHCPYKPGAKGLPSVQLLGLSPAPSAARDASPREGVEPVGDSNKRPEGQ
jgi:hypothetical protein